MPTLELPPSFTGRLFSTTPGHPGWFGLDDSGDGWLKLVDKTRALPLRFTYQGLKQDHPRYTVQLGDKGLAISRNGYLGIYAGSTPMWHLLPGEEAVALPGAISVQFHDDEGFSVKLLSEEECVNSMLPDGVEARCALDNYLNTSNGQALTVALLIDEE